MTKARIKILFFIPSLTGGGAEKVLCNLVNNMDPEKFDITVNTVEPGEADVYLKPHIHYRSVIHNRQTWPGGKKWLRGLKYLAYRLLAELKLVYPLFIKDQYDIEVAFLECGATKVMAASNSKRAKKLAWVHCNVEKKGLTLEKSGRYYKRFDRIVCVSEDARLHFNRVFGMEDKSMVIYNLIDEAEIMDKLASGEEPVWDKGLLHICVIGRLCHEKGSDRMLEVCRRMAEDGISVQTHFVGNGPDMETMRQYIQEHGLEASVKLEGFQNNPYVFMKAADLIVIPSRTEALSTVAIEAMILGKALVTTPCAGMAEILGSSEYGLITEDSVDSLYNNIKKLVEKPGLRDAYAKAAKDRSGFFKKEKILKETENFFMSLV